MPKMVLGITNVTKSLSVNNQKFDPVFQSRLSQGGKDEETNIFPNAMVVGEVDLKRSYFS
jgi:hypothetical protein